MEILVKVVIVIIVNLEILKELVITENYLDMHQLCHLDVLPWPFQITLVYRDLIWKQFLQGGTASLRCDECKISGTGMRGLVMMHCLPALL